jgi:hypothetical protein
MIKLYYTARSDNSKTGDIPQQWIGADHDESKRSCVDTDGTPCPLLAKICYAQNGTVGHLGFGRVISTSRKDAGRYALRSALNRRSLKARFVRFGSIGDPSAIAVRLYTYHYNMVRKVGLGVLSYTHFWKTKGSRLKGKALASCDTMEDAKAAVDAGWRATIHLDDASPPQGKTKDGYSYTVCPAQRGYEYLGKRENRRKNPVYDSRYAGITCNDCGLCDPERKGLDIVVFMNH